MVRRIRREGFTLIELLVVIAIIAILAAILFPVFAKAREKARQTTCLNNQRQIAAAILMFIQDHDETFPTASTWTTDLSSSYGVTGKVWDCPTSSFKGTEATPDYFYVGGSYLSGAALGDVKQPTEAPLLGDLASSASRKPYIPDTNGQTDVNMAVSSTDTRHNNGAVFAFTDGHTGWLAKQSLTPLFFLPSVIDGSNILLSSLGPIFSTDTAKTNLYSTLTNLGISIALGSKSSAGSNSVIFHDGVAGYEHVVNQTTWEIAAGAGAPSWWTLGPGGSSLNKPYFYTATVSVPIPWGATTALALDCGADYDTGSRTLIIKPNVTTATYKRMAIIAHSIYGPCQAQINSVQIGSDPAVTSFTPAPIAQLTSLNADPAKPNPKCNAVVMLLPVHPGKTIVIKYQAVSTRQYPAVSLAFEN